MIRLQLTAALCLAYPEARAPMQSASMRRLAIRLFQIRAFLRWNIV